MIIIDTSRIVSTSLSMLRAKGVDFDAAYRASNEALAIREQVYGVISHEVAEVVQQQGLVPGHLERVSLAAQHRQVVVRHARALT